MSIFSFFGKKDQQQPITATEKAVRPERAATAKEPRNNVQPIRQPHAARVTAQKIDAIESEMTSEFIKPSTRPASTNKPTSPVPAKSAPAEAKNTSPETEADVGLLDEDALLRSTVPVPDTDAIEEAAIMFANNQSDVAEQMLRFEIAEDKPGAKQAWCMLFDLYRITGKQQAFEELSLDYLNKFETSPPAWMQLGDLAASVATGATPTVAFTGKLAIDSIKLIERIQRLAENHRALRLEFPRVKEVDPAGCALLLRALKKLQKSGHELILVGAEELMGKIDCIVQPGRRDNTEPAWLLSMEILRLLNREKEFEERSMDYCVTFEISPPPFTASASKVTTAVAEPMTNNDPESVVMPAVIEGNVEPIIASIAEHLAKHDVGMVDCSGLTRIEFHAAGRLMSGIAPLCQHGKHLEFHHVNHLVAVLFKVMGLSELVRVFPAKH